MSDFRTTTGEPLPIGSRQRRLDRKRWLKRAAWILAAMLIIGFIIPVSVKIPATGYVTTDDYAEVRPSEAGAVADILAVSGQRVRRGDLLVRLNDGVQQAAHAEAVNAVSQAQARLTQREAELAQENRQRGHRLTQAELRHRHAGVMLKMTEDLHTKGLASGKVLEEARTALALASSDLESLRDEDVTLADKMLDVLRRDLDVKTNAALRAEAQLHDRHIYAPIDGETVRYDFVPGELVTPQSVLYELFGGSNLILKLRVPERYATEVTLDSPYKAVLSIYPGLGRPTFRGRISALRAVIQTDNQQTYRMAYCTFENGGMSVPPGTSAEARITVATVPFWFWIFGVR